MVEHGDELEVTEGGLTLPAADVLTGRGFVTGKSGSGKSNTASVLVEELLDRDSRLLVVDTDGEYYGLKEDYELLHLGADGDRCDAAVSPRDADTIADLAFDAGVPVVLDVSGFLDSDDADLLVFEVVKRLFSRAREVRQPFLLLVEEVHEFVPQQGGLDDVGEMLVRVAKRGRKRGLGLCGLSQRPASVDKDFITQCDWLVWHRLTWANDTKAAARILGDEYGTAVEGLETGEAFLLADWEADVKRVQFRRKRTFDAGATPGFGSAEAPDLRPVDADWLEQFRDVGSEETTAGDPGDDEPVDEHPEREADGPTESETGDDTATETYPRGGPSTGGSTATGRQPDAGRGPTVDESAETRSPPEPPESASGDGKVAVWELGQLVTYLIGAVVRGTANGLARLWRLAVEQVHPARRHARRAVRRADRAVCELGVRTRSAWSRARSGVVGEQASFPQTAGADANTHHWSGPPEHGTADRVLGLAVLVAVALVVVAVYALLVGRAA